MEEPEQIIAHLAEEFRGLRPGRATPALVENILVEAYGTKMPVRSLAAISAPDPRTLLIEPWDQTVIAAIEAAIGRSSLGAQPAVDQQKIRVSLPALTEERRRELIRLVSQKTEEARVRLRRIREEERERIIADERAKKISEDGRFRQLKELDKGADEWMEKVEELRKKKEEEILS